MTTPEKNLDYEENVSVSDVHASVKREHEDPQTGLEPATIRVFAVCALFLVIGGAYLGANGRFNGSSVMPGYTPEPPPGAAPEDGSTDPRTAWLKKGKSNYATCAGCHQGTGNGTPGMFPPLAGSEWVNGGTERLTALVLHGLSGPITVKGQPWNSLMPAHKDIFSSEKIAQVLTFVRNSWGNEGSFITTEMVDAAKEKYASQPGAFTNATLPPADADLPGALPEWAGGAPAAEAPAPAPAEGAAEPAADPVPAG